MLPQELTVAVQVGSLLVTRHFRTRSAWGKTERMLAASFSAVGGIRNLLIKGTKYVSYVTRVNANGIPLGNWFLKVLGS
eukprot:scaffold7428_cov63-Cylindrotheca_fusiformis.AAC.1